LRPIESIVAGDRVWAYNLIASEWQLRPVLKSYSVFAEGFAAAVTVAGETIDSTYCHPYFVVRGEDLEERPFPEHITLVPDGATTPGRWVDAGDLRIGDELLLLDGRIERVENVRLYSSYDRVYNFAVDDLHSYAVGRCGVLVHNENGKATTINAAPSRAQGVGDPVGASSSIDVSPSGVTQVTPKGGQKSLLPGEVQVGTYDDLIAAGSKGDNITPHHIPSARHMEQHGVSKGDGISINMEQPSPGKAGRHRRTFTYGTQADVNLSPRDALGRGVWDVRRIYQEDGLYGPNIRRSLQNHILQSKQANPGLFD
jgi:hypothetical protein